MHRMARETHTDPLLAEIRAGLARKGLTQADLAQHLHTSRGAISRRLTGDVAFDYREIRSIAHLIGVPVAVLYAEPALAEGGEQR